MREGGVWRGERDETESKKDLDPTGLSDCRRAVFIGNDSYRNRNVCTALMHWSQKSMQRYSHDMIGL